MDFFIKHKLLLLLLLAVDVTTCEKIRSVGGSFRRAVGVTYLSSLAVLTPLILRSNQDDSSREKKLRTQLLSAIRPNSRVLEIGFGSGGGANMDYYPAHAGVAVTGLDLMIAESSDLLTNRKLYDASGVFLEALISGDAESLSRIFPPASFDVVVGTLVLCSVRDPELVLTEISKVLKPKSGLFLSVEHVHSTKTNTMLARTQELLDPLQQIVANNCHLTRRTDELLATSGPRLGLRLERCDPVFFPSQFPISSQVYSRMARVG